MKLESKTTPTALIKELMAALDAMLDGWQMRPGGGKWEVIKMPSPEAGFGAWLAISNANAYLEKVGAND